MSPARLGKYFVGHRQSVRLEWCPCRSSFVFAASVAVAAVVARGQCCCCFRGRYCRCCFAGGTVVVVAASVAVSFSV